MTTKDKEELKREIANNGFTYIYDLVDSLKLGISNTAEEFNKLFGENKELKEQLLNSELISKSLYCCENCGGSSDCNGCNIHPDEEYKGILESWTPSCSSVLRLRELQK